MDIKKYTEKPMPVELEPVATKRLGERLILFFKWAGDSVKAFVSTLMIFMWFLVAYFLLDSYNLGTISSVDRMFEYVLPIVWNWEKMFFFIFLSRITYNAYNIWRWDWRKQ